MPTNSDKAYRDAACMAYICTVMDLSASDFYTQVKPTIKNKIDEEAFIKMMLRDFDVRMKRLLES